MLNKARIEHTLMDSKINNFSYELKNAADEKSGQSKLLNSSIFENDGSLLKENTKTSLEILDDSEKKYNYCIDLINKENHCEKKSIKENHQLDVIKIENDNITCLDEGESLLHIMGLKNKFLPIDNFPAPQSSNIINKAHLHPTDNSNSLLQTSCTLPVEVSINTPTIRENKEKIIIDVSDNEESVRNQCKIIDLKNIISENDCALAIENVIDSYLERHEGIPKIKSNLNQRLQEIMTKKVNIDQSITS